MAKKKQQEMELTDEYFLHLIMKYDERDDNIYPKWAIWCAQSEDKYYIDGKDGAFYTHVRTEKEIALERKKHEIENLIFSQDFIELTEKNKEKYEEYLRNLLFDEEHLLEVIPLSYEKWKNQSKESAE